MLGLIEFITSFFLVSFSSVFFAFSLKEKKLANTLIYSALILISQVIISFEILSLLKNINPAGVLVCNAVFFAAAAVLWNMRNRPIPDFTPLKQAAKQVFTAIKSDKILMILGILFAFSALITLFFVIFAPVNNLDALEYKLTRVAFWIQNGTLDHFSTPSMRQVSFPINFELTLLWSMVFLKRDYLAIFPAFLSYFACLGLVSVFLKNLNISVKRILWTVLILGSLPIMITEASSAQSDMFIGFLLFSSFYLFYFSLKNQGKLPLIFSAIAYAIALGAKSTSILFIPAFAIVYLIMSIRNNGKNFYKPLLKFSLYLIAGFIVLGAFNYILNYLYYGNVFGPYAMIKQHATPGLKAFIPSSVLYMAYFADFSGINFVEKLNPEIIKGITSFLKAIGYKLSDGVCIGDLKGLNYWVHENLSNFGLLGYSLIFPFIAVALTKFRSNMPKQKGFSEMRSGSEDFSLVPDLRKSELIKNSKISENRTFDLALCSLFLPVFILTLALAMGFSIYCIRYFATAVILCSPIFIFSYNRKIGFYKILIALIVAFNYLVMPTYSKQKPFIEVVKLLGKSDNFNKFRGELRLRAGHKLEHYYQEYHLIKEVSTIIPDNSRIGLVYSVYDAAYPFFEQNPTWKIYPVRYEKFITEKSFDKFDFLIFAGNKQNQCPLEKNVKYGYYPNYTKRTIHFRKKGAGVIKTIYANRDNQIMFKGKPIKMANIYEDSKISGQYEFVKKITINKPTRKSSGFYRIFKKL